MDKLMKLKLIGDKGAIRQPTKIDYDEFDLGPDLDYLLESVDSDLEVIDDDRPISRMEFYARTYSGSSESGSANWRSSVDTEIEISEESDQLPDLMPIDSSNDCETNKIFETNIFLLSQGQRNDRRKKSVSQDILMSLCLCLHSPCLLLELIWVLVCEIHS